ncbi:DUF1800 domain-containing protein [Iamia majanohamensis]|uniref:DUF1800 domain-containing protein n=1 Tax=Iamia majanohamensis TaxID=467976 RepID=A0AAE9Y7Z2_9ACTN|nr:DUF1800 domain-containing protein [Iamia majanohamensis]WCO68464.1 DUF1800 domain-containing protein [Iamia majanohamensis]
MSVPRADVAHLLRRAGFGGTVAEVDALAALPSWTAVVDRVLDTSAAPADSVPAAVEDREDQWYPPWVAAVHHWTDRMATSPTPIVEKMALFWHGLFTSSTDKVYPRLVFHQVATYRRLGLGDLHTLAQAMAVDPAMLVYLDNESNVAGKPNENFARELMELFLLGQGHYGEADVAAMARAWTGHGVDRTTERYAFSPSRHDAGTKTIFGITRAWDGPDTITEMVRGSRQAACARFITTKLWTFLAGPPIAPATLDALAGAFVASGMQVRALVRALFLHPDFRAPATRTGLVRSPVEWVAATMRALGLPAAVLHPEWWVERCGQRLYAPPNVGGWRGNEGWISTSTAWGRAAFASHTRWKASDAGVFAGYGDLAPAVAVQRALDRFGIDDPSPVTRSSLEAFVAGEQTARRRWAVTPGLVALTMLSPDFQMA